MSADCKATSNGLDERFLKVKVSAANVARAIDQERDVSGNRNVGHTCWDHVIKSDSKF